MIIILLCVILLIALFFVLLEIKFRRTPESSIKLSYSIDGKNIISNDKFCILPLSIDNASEVVAIVHDVECLLVEPKVKKLDIALVSFPAENYFKTSLVNPKSGLPVAVFLPKDLPEGKLQFQIKYSGRRGMSLHLSKFHFKHSSGSLEGGVVYEKAYTN